MNANHSRIFPAITVWALCSGCGSSLKMRADEPLQVSRGYAIDDTRFYQNEQQLDRADVKRKLEGRTASADSVRRGESWESAAIVTRALGFIGLLFGVDGLLPNSSIKMSQRTSTALLAGGGALLGVSVGFSLAAESNYVDAVEQHNLRFSASALKESNAQANASAKDVPSREEFPQKVVGYAFRTSVADAQAVCRAAAQQWTLHGSEASCARTERSKKDALDVRLTFVLGALSAITVSYKSPSDSLGRDYTTLAQAFRAKYGKPQVEASRPPARCASALGECLAQGEKVKPLVWSWSRGSLELEPVWRDEQAEIEVRYLAADMSAP